MSLPRRENDPPFASLVELRVSFFAAPPTNWLPSRLCSARLMDPPHDVPGGSRRLPSPRDQRWRFSRP